MPTIAELTIDLHANVAALRSDFAKAQRETQRFTSGIETGFRQLRNLIGGLGLAVGTAEIVSLGKAAFNSAADLSDLSAQLRVGAESLQIMELSAIRSGSSMEAMRGNIAQLNEAIGEAVSGNRAMVRAFEQLGVAFANADGSARAADAVLQDLSAAYQRAGDKTRFAADLTDIMGKSAQALIPVLADLSVSWNELSRTVAETGLSQAAADDFGRIRDELELTSQRFEMFIQRWQHGVIKFLQIDRLMGIEPDRREQIDALREQIADLEKHGARTDLFGRIDEWLSGDVREQYIADLRRKLDVLLELEMRAAQLVGPRAPLPTVVTNPPVSGQPRGGGGRSGDEFPLGQDFIPPQKPLSPTQQKIIDEALSGGSIGMLATRLQETDMEAEELAASVGDLTRSLGEAALGMRDWRDVALSTVADLLNGITNQLLQMAGIGGGGGGGGIGGLFGDVIGGLVGGLFGGGLTADPFPGTTGRARGGRVYAGRSYTVGERGREWFTPDENGFVGAAAGGGGMIVNIDARGATRDAIAGIRRELRALNASVERRVDARVMDSRRRGGDFGRTLK
jgi:hypothetical protein